MGEMKYTGNELDVTLQGPGFFVVDTPQGELYTRMGNFSLNTNDELITQEGVYPQKRWKRSRQDDARTIRIEGTEITIEKDGSISVDGNRD